MIGNIFDIDLKMIRVFCTIVECGGFTAAQTVLNVGLPRLSTTISDLEIRLGTRLCQRGRQGFRLTSEGAATYEAARALLNDVDRFRERISTLAARPSFHDAPMNKAALGAHLAGTHRAGAHMASSN